MATAVIAAQAAAEAARRRRAEEETLTRYSEADLEQNWQFKIVTGNFSTLEKVQAVIQEQTAWGWVFVEKFDDQRIRFKRAAGEATQDATRPGNPYATNSKAARGCATTAALVLLVAGGLCWLIAVIA